MTITTINPATEEVLESIPLMGAMQIQRRIEKAADAYREFRHEPAGQRARWISAAAELLEEGATRLASVITTEMGKPIEEAEAEVHKCAWCCRYYAEHAPAFLRDEVVDTGEMESHVRYRPLGVLLAVMPWNFPFWQVFRFAVPALMAGNVVLLKHASNVPRCALTIEELFGRAGLPEGVFQTLLIDAGLVANVLKSEHVAGATLTGSEAAGQSVAAIAGREVKKTVLELGGSDPFIVMPSADLNQAVSTGVRARIVNSGQSCIAAKRFILAEEIAAEFEGRFVQAFESLRVGNPINRDTQVGPLATRQVLETLDDQVHHSKAQGARVLTGGRRVPTRGYYYVPTVLADVPESSPVYREEVFGPVAAMFRVRTVEEAIRLANDTRFGLGASVWTHDPDERARFLDEIEAGAVFINSMVRSDPRLPFGGVKHSGYGRELGPFGIHEFVSLQTVSKAA